MQMWLLAERGYEYQPYPKQTKESNPKISALKRHKKLLCPLSTAAPAKERRAWNRYINGFHRLYQINNPLFQPKKEKITDEAPFFAPPVSTLQIAGASDFSVYVPYSMQKMRHRKAYSYYKQYRQQYDNAQ